jgi:phage shock protein PspC (stress-responsive transcriptional regulator)
MRRLYRSRHNRKIAGICGGLAEYFDLDPTLIRLIFVAALIFTGLLPMLLIYLIGWIVIPEASHS